MGDRPLATTSCRASDVSFRQEFRRIGRSTTAGMAVSKKLRRFTGNSGASLWVNLRRLDTRLASVLPGLQTRSFARFLRHC
jgi:hypothetical protein